MACLQLIDECAGVNGRVRLARARRQFERRRLEIASGRHEVATLDAIPTQPRRLEPAEARRGDTGRELDSRDTQVREKQTAQTVDSRSSVFHFFFIFSTSFSPRLRSVSVFSFSSSLSSRMSEYSSWLVMAASRRHQEIQVHVCKCMHNCREGSRQTNPSCCRW